MHRRASIHSLGQTESIQVIWVRLKILIEDFLSYKYVFICIPASYNNNEEKNKLTS